MKKYQIDYIITQKQEIEAENIFDLMKKLTTKSRFGVTKEDLKSFMNKAKSKHFAVSNDETEARIYVSDMNDSREVRILFCEDLEE